ncbi:MAG: hypothetical protein KY463_16390 [Actinobacteria bacterium]|nr:hypothetical protein [Actinomycetota bacterium]
MAAAVGGVALLTGGDDKPVAAPTTPPPVTSTAPRPTVSSPPKPEDVAAQQAKAGGDAARLELDGKLDVGRPAAGREDPRRPAQGSAPQLQLGCEHACRSRLDGQAHAQARTEREAHAGVAAFARRLQRDDVGEAAREAPLVGGIGQRPAQRVAVSGDGARGDDGPQAAVHEAAPYGEEGKFDHGLLAALRAAVLPLWCAEWRRRVCEQALVILCAGRAAE